MLACQMFLEQGTGCYKCLGFNENWPFYAHIFGLQLVERFEEDQEVWPCPRRYVTGNGL